MGFEGAAFSAVLFSVVAIQTQASNSVKKPNIDSSWTEIQNYESTFPNRLEFFRSIVRDCDQWAHDPAVPPLLKANPDADCFLLRKIGYSAYPAIQEFLNSNDLITQLRGIRLLIEINYDVYEYDSILQAAENSTDPLVNRETLLVISQFSEPATPKAFTKIAQSFLTSADPATRRYALTAYLNLIFINKAWPEVAQALQDPDDRVRENALHLLLSFQSLPPDIVELVKKNMHDPNPEVRIVAIDSAINIPNLLTPEIDQLILNIDSQNQGLAGISVRALQSLTPNNTLVVDKLLRAAKTPSLALKRVMPVILYQEHSDDYIAFLKQKLKDPDPIVRRETFESMCCFSELTFKAEIENALNDPDENIRMRAWLHRRSPTLDLNGGDPKYFEGLRDKSEKVRDVVAFDLQGDAIRFEKATTIQLINIGLNDESRFVRSRMVGVIETFDHSTSATPNPLKEKKGWIEKLLQDPDSNLRMAGLSLYRNWLHNEGNLIPFIQALHDPAPDVRMAALDLLFTTNYDDKMKLEEINHAITDENVKVASAAISLLLRGYPKSDQTRDTLISLIHSPRLEIKTQVVQALYLVKGQQAAVIKILVELLKQKNPYLRQSAMECLLSMEGRARDAIPALIEISDNKDDELSDEAQEVMLRVDQTYYPDLAQAHDLNIRLQALDLHSLETSNDRSLFQDTLLTFELLKPKDQILAMDFLKASMRSQKTENSRALKMEEFVRHFKNAHSFPFSAIELIQDSIPQSVELIAPALRSNSLKLVAGQSQISINTLLEQGFLERLPFDVDLEFLSEQIPQNAQSDETATTLDALNFIERSRAALNFSRESQPLLNLSSELRRRYLDSKELRINVATLETLVHLTSHDSTLQSEHDQLLKLLSEMNTSK